MWLATPETVIGTVATTPSFPIVPAFHQKGDSDEGKAVFGSSGCGGCHTLAAAHSTGTIGPNLDTLKPDYRAVTAQVTNGGGAMPAFKGTLSTQQIADVAAYVVKSTGGTARSARPPADSRGTSPLSRSISTGH